MRKRRIVGTQLRVEARYVRVMEEARRVLDRLDRIESLQRGSAEPPVLLQEVRALLAEAEAWVRAEAGGSDGAPQAVSRVREALQQL